MNNIVSVFQSASVLLGMLAIGILNWVNYNQSHGKRLLMYLLLAITLVNLNGAIYQSGGFIFFPWLHKVLYPVTLLIAPFSYLYIRATLLQEFKFRKFDWVIFIPSILLAINLMPYYLMPIDQKKIEVIRYYEHSGVRAKIAIGVLTNYVYPFLRFAWSLFFIGYNFITIKKFIQDNSKEIVAKNSTTIKWVKGLNYMLALLLAVSLMSAVIAALLDNDFYIADLTLGLLTIVIAVILFCNPKILYGIHMPSISAELANDNELQESVVGINSDIAVKYKSQVENHFTTHKPFLDAGYSLEQLAVDLNMPRYVLSAFINREYNMGFREFLNRYRIEYMIAQLNKSEWEQYTLEAIAEECGFKSRTTFIKNFKEITGLTPSAYLKKIARNKNPIN